MYKYIKRPLSARNTLDRRIFIYLFVFYLSMCTVRAHTHVEYAFYLTGQKKNKTKNEIQKSYITVVNDIFFFW